MFRIKLTFYSGSTIQLLRVDCSIGNEVSHVCVRGKTGGAYGNVGTFQWSSAVRATACVFLKAKIWDESAGVEPMLSGGAKSFAASLDYALAKQPGWIMDMFGVSAGGKTYARRLFRLTNSHRKRSGPVAVSLNLHLCPQHCVEVVLDGKVIESREVLRAMLDSIEASEWEANSLRKEGGAESCKNEPCISLAA